MRKIKAALLGIFLVSLFSCQQEIDDILAPPPTNGGGGNGNGGGTGGGTTTGSYQPLTAGSWWEYRDSATTTLSTLTATANTQTFGGINYREVTSSQGGTSVSMWYASPVPNYYFRTTGISPSGLPFEITSNFLNDTASVGYSWEYVAGQGNGFTALMKTTILAKGLTVTIQGKTYNNVIKTGVELSYDLSGIVMQFAEYEYLVAKEVGIIRARSAITFPGSALVACSELIDHHIQ